jgi:hypothetical protein
MLPSVCVREWGNIRFPSLFWLGSGLLQDAIRRSLMIAEHAGIRAVLTHPIDDGAVRFYQRFGFIASPSGDQQLLLLLKDAKCWVD